MFSNGVEVPTTQPARSDFLLHFDHFNVMLKRIIRKSNESAQTLSSRYHID